MVALIAFLLLLCYGKHTAPPPERKAAALTR